MKLPTLTKNWLDRGFLLSERRTTLLVETRAGLSTFMVMAYIIFVNPSILGDVADPTGATLSSAAVLSVTCLTAGVLSILMGVFCNYPFALAPGMGLNAVVALHLVGQLNLTWVQAMTVVLIQGLIILILVLTQFREAMMDAIPLSLKKSIGAGIGLFLAVIGCVNGGLITQGEGVVLSLGKLGEMSVLTFLFGFFLTTWFMIRKLKGALLWGILSTTVLAVILNAWFGSQQAFGSAALVPTQLWGSLKASPALRPSLAAGTGDFLLNWGCCLRSWPSFLCCSQISSTPWAPWWVWEKKESSSKRTESSPGSEECC